MPPSHIDPRQPGRTLCFESESNLGRENVSKERNRPDGPDTPHPIWISLPSVTFATLVIIQSCDQPPRGSDGKAGSVAELWMPEYAYSSAISKVTCLSILCEYIYEGNMFSPWTVHRTFLDLEWFRCGSYNIKLLSNRSSTILVLDNPLIGNFFHVVLHFRLLHWHTCVTVVFVFHDITHSAHKQFQDNTIR